MAHCSRDDTMRLIECTSEATVASSSTSVCDSDARGGGGGGGGAKPPIGAPMPGPLRRTNQRRDGEPGAYRVVGPAGGHGDDASTGGLRHGVDQDRSYGNGSRATAIVEASLVTEPPLAVAEPYDEQRYASSAATLQVQTPQRRPMLLLTFLGVAVVSLVVGVTMSIVGRSKGDVPSMGDVQTGEDWLRSILPNSTVAAMEVPGSPQYLALQWVVDDNYPLELDADDDERHHRRKQRFALAVLFYAVNSGTPRQAALENWLRHNTSECEWYGCTCSEERQVQELRLRDADVVGYLPPEIGLLDQLVSVDGGSTSVFGPLPTELAALTRLSDLRLDHTRLSGTIPTEVGLLTSLEVLQLHSTEFTGTLPSELGALTNVATLRIDNTRLNGTLPTELGQLTSLTYMSAKSTIIGRTIPTELGLLSNLAWLELHETFIRGTVPKELCSLMGSTKLHISVTCVLVTCDCGCACGSDLLVDDGTPGPPVDDMTR
jgi:hypothetical protein